MIEAAVRLALFLSLGLLIAWAALVLFTYRMLTRPPRRTYASALARNRPADPSQLPPSSLGVTRTFETWTIPSRFGPLGVWDMPGDDPGAPILLLSHGWGDSRIGALTRAPHFLPLCSRLVMWDMPGHGESPGHCTLGTSETDDLLRLIERLNPDRPLVLVGWSLGAGVSIAAAARSPHPIAAVIAEAPYRLAPTPARNVLSIMALPHQSNLLPALRLVNLFSAAPSVFDAFDRADLARRLPCPLLVIQGELDNVSPLEDARAIAAAAPNATLLSLPQAGHHGLWTDPESAHTCTQAVRSLLASLPGGKGDSVSRS